MTVHAGSHRVGAASLAQVSPRKVTLIVAYARNRVIGRDNRLPWQLPGDLAYFKRCTLGHAVVMGRKTWESLSRPLPGRLNVVISRDKHYVASGAIVVPDIEAALAIKSSTDEIFIIGGAQLYAAMLPHADCILATEINAEVAGDTFFPVLPVGFWREISRQKQSPENNYDYDFVVYERK
jgi:dihydrofolate reductase